VSRPAWALAQHAARTARKAFFSEEKDQKPLDLQTTAAATGATREPEVFWLFFSKKNCFLAGLNDTYLTASLLIQLRTPHAA
jgi:hypothetical protein